MTVQLLSGGDSLRTVVFATGDKVSEGLLALKSSR
jgi:hypothetical protein